MFDIGFWEMLLIGVLTMIIVGPEKLPGVARTAGRWFGKARRFIEGVKTEVEQEFDVTDLKRMLHNQEVQINELTQKLDNPNLLDEEIESITSSIYSIEDEVVDNKSTDDKSMDDNGVDDNGVDNSSMDDATAKNQTTDESNQNSIKSND